MIKFFTFFTVAVVLSGCSVYSNPEIPENKFKSWAETVANEKAKVDQKWWKNFHDEVLNEIIEKAHDNNKDLVIAKARINQARAQQSAVLSENLPFINANGNITRSKNSTTLSDRPILTKFSNNFKADFDASWEVDIFGIEPSVRAAKQWSEKNIEDYNNILITLYGDVASSYFEVRKLQLQSDILAKKVKEVRDSLGLKRSLSKAGKIDYVQVYQSENELSNAESQLEITKNNLKQEIYKLEALVGLEPSSLKEVLVRPYKYQAPTQQLIASAPASVLSQRPDVRSAEKNYLYATSVQDVAVMQLFPRISLAGLLGFEAGRESLLFNSRSEIFKAAGGLTTPIFDWKRIQADIKDADAKSMEALANYKKSVINALSDVESSFAGYKSSKDNLNIIDKGYNSTKAEVSLARDKYNKGQISYIDLADSKIRMQDSDLKFADAKFENLKQVVRVYKALGGGW